MTEFNFSTNWNNKFDCKVFTTFRPHYHRRFKPGEKVSMTYITGKKEKKTFVAEFICSVPTLLPDCPEVLCYLDTGFSKAEFIEIVKKMYQSKNYDFDKQMFAFYLFKKI